MKLSEGMLQKVEKEKEKIGQLLLRHTSLTEQQLNEALETRATSILLDNFSPETLPETIKHIRSHKNGKNIYIELSGGINSDNIDSYCIKGVNGISMGALTHNIKSKDISLDLK